MTAWKTLARSQNIIGEGPSRKAGVGAPGGLSRFSIRLLISAQVTISGSCDGSPHGALCSAGSLLEILPLSPSAFPLQYINNPLKKKGYLLNDFDSVAFWKRHSSGDLKSSELMSGRLGRRDERAEHGDLGGSESPLSNAITEGARHALCSMISTDILIFYCVLLCLLCLCILLFLLKDFSFPLRVPINIFLEGWLLVMNFFSYCLPRKLYLSFYSKWYYHWI